MELLRDKGYDVLCMTDNVDEFTIRMMNQYKEKSFKSIADGDLGLEDAVLLLDPVGPLDLGPGEIAVDIQAALHRS